MRLVVAALVMVSMVAAGSAVARTHSHPPARIAAHSARHAPAHRPAHAVRVAALHASRRPLGGSLVRCTLLRQPRPDPRSAAGRRGAPVFAPTSQAVFFARAGDRCVWHTGTAVHG